MVLFSPPSSIFLAEEYEISQNLCLYDIENMKVEGGGQKSCTMIQEAAGVMKRALMPLW